MLKKNTLVITGITGFIGKSILKNKDFVDNFTIYGLSRSGYFKLENSLIEIDEKTFLESIKQPKGICVLHLATYYSLDEADKDEIIHSNYNFGLRFFNLLLENDIVITTILYTNTMFSFFDDNKIRRSTYVLTKNKFSKYLTSLSEKEGINFIEIYLNNTFGPNDTRKKIIPLIFDSLLNKKRFEIKNPEKFISLIPIDKILEIFIKLLNKKENYKGVVYSSLEYELGSLNSYIFKSFNNKKIEKIKSIKFIELNDVPKNIELIIIDYELEIELEKLLSELR